MRRGGKPGLSGSEIQREVPVVEKASPNIAVHDQVACAHWTPDYDAVREGE
jgi:hypothetical protein